MTLHEPLTSVIIPTYNREEVLCQTIGQVLIQDYPAFEVIVVDQTPKHDPETQQFLVNYADKIRYFRLAKPSLPKARNYGVQQAKGEIVVFLDDDVIIRPNWLQAHVKNFQDSRIGGISGRILEKDMPVTDIAATDIGRVTRLGRVINNQTSTLRTEIEWASGGNSSFRRKLIEKAGGFDETFQGNAVFEDVDFSFRLRRLGYAIYFDPEALVVHLAEQQGGCETRTKDRVNYYYWFIHNKTLFFMKNFPRRYWPFMFATNIARAVKIGLLEARSWEQFIFLYRATWAGVKLYLQSQP
jgi:GT2 family glycosyltransferase